MKRTSWRILYLLSAVLRICIRIITFMQIWIRCLVKVMNIWNCWPVLLLGELHILACTAPSFSLWCGSGSDFSNWVGPFRIWIRRRSTDHGFYKILENGCSTYRNRITATKTAYRNSRRQLLSCSTVLPRCRLLIFYQNEIRVRNWENLFLEILVGSTVIRPFMYRKVYRYRSLLWTNAAMIRWKDKTDSHPCPINQRVDVNFLVLYACTYFLFVCVNSRNKNIPVSLCRLLIGYR